MQSLHVETLQVLDEIGIDLSAKLGAAAAPNHKAVVATAQRHAEDEELEKALAALKA